MLYKLGAVPYLNALPLIHYLKERPKLAAPAALTRLLQLGEVDIATAPVVALFENPDYTLIPGICIGSNGRVESVKLFFRDPKITVENVQSIYLDMESKTSALLLKVLLKYKFGRNLDEIMFYHPIPHQDEEARLLIGDKAMKNPPNPPLSKGGEGGFLDLGHEWTSWTGLPFVYAAWVGRSPEVSKRAIHELTEARDKGWANIASVVPANGPFPFATIKNYLENNIIYRLGEKELRGMELFRDYLIRDGLLHIPAKHLLYAVS